MSDEHTGEFGIDIPLGKHLGARCLKPCLNTGQATEPNEIQASAAKRTHRCGVVAHRHVLHRHIQLFAQLIREGVVKTVELLRVLIRNRTNPKRGCFSAGICGTTSGKGSSQPQPGEEAGKDDGSRLSIMHQKLWLGST